MPVDWRKNRKLWAVGLILMAACIVLVVILTIRQLSGPAPAGNDAPPEGFSFFEIGRNTVLTEEIRNKLSEELGSGAVETRTPVDLEIHYPGFLRDRFPLLEALHRELNYESGVKRRIEHDTTKLTFRYARKKNTPFTYVEMIFYNRTGRPLLVKVKASDAGASIAEAVEKKYGMPDKFSWEENETRYWRDQDDILLISRTRDRYGDPEYLASIFYTTNLKELLAAEQQEAAGREEEKMRRGTTAF